MSRWIQASLSWALTLTRSLMISSKFQILKKIIFVLPETLHNGSSPSNNFRLRCISLPCLKDSCGYILNLEFRWQLHHCWGQLVLNNQSILDRFLFPFDHLSCLYSTFHFWMFQFLSTSIHWHWICGSELCCNELDRHQLSQRWTHRQTDLKKINRSGWIELVLLGAIDSLSNSGALPSCLTCKIHFSEITKKFLSVYWIHFRT